MAARSSNVFTLASVTILGGLIAYAVYFDYRRRNDLDFRKKLRKDKKRVHKQVSQASSESGSSISPDELQAALAKVREEPIPPTSEEKERFFMAQVSLGEQLCAQGPAFQLPAALSFYRALRVYPSPVELIMIYQKTVPEHIFKIVMELTNLDVKDRVEGYYDNFPPKSMNVSVQNSPVEATRKILVVEKDVEAGEVIYKEEPLVAALDLDIEGKGTHCSHCLRSIQKGMAIRPEFDRLNAVYCSKDCQVKSKVQSQNLLFSLDPVLPPELDDGVGELTKAARATAQSAFIEYIQTNGKAAPLLAARFVARQVAVEIAKMVPSKTGLVEATAGTDGSYGMYDHIERLRFINVHASDEEVKLLSAVFAAAVPGLEQSVPSERHITDMGKMAYNAVGVCFSGGRDDKPAPKERPEDQERTRTPYGSSRQVGCGLYPVSAYLNHSCAPSARPSFSSGTSELHLIATRALRKGDELTMSYVDVSQRPGEAPDEARRRRRTELARGWKFKCECTRCIEELATVPASAKQESDVAVERDESKVEDVVHRINSSAPQQTYLGPD